MNSKWSVNIMSPAGVVTRQYVFDRKIDAEQFKRGLDEGKKKMDDKWRNHSYTNVVFKLEQVEA